MNSYEYRCPSDHCSPDAEVIDHRYLFDFGEVYQYYECPSCGTTWTAQFNWDGEKQHINWKYEDNWTYEDEIDLDIEEKKEGTAY